MQNCPQCHHPLAAVLANRRQSCSLCGWVEPPPMPEERADAKAQEIARERNLDSTSVWKYAGIVLGALSLLIFVSGFLVKGMTPIIKREQVTQNQQQTEAIPSTPPSETPSPQPTSTPTPSQEPSTGVSASATPSSDESALAEGINEVSPSAKESAIIDAVNQAEGPPPSSQTSLPVESSAEDSEPATIPLPDGLEERPAAVPSR
jgi:hypothetical protein